MNMKDHRLSTELLGPPIDPDLFPFGTDAIREYDDCDHDPIGCRSWLVVLAIGLIAPLCVSLGARLSLKEPTYPGAEYVRAIHAAHPELDNPRNSPPARSPGKSTQPSPRAEGGWSVYK